MFASRGKKKNSTQSSSNDLSDKIEVFIQSLNDEKDQKLCHAICNKVTKEDHKHKSPQVGKDGTLIKCRVLLEQGADPNVLIQLEELLRKRQDENALIKHTNPSSQVNGPKTPDELKESLKKQKEDYKYYIQIFLPALKEEIIKSAELAKLPVFNKEIEQSQKSQTRKGEIIGIILSIPNINGYNKGPENSEQSINLAKKSYDNKILTDLDISEEMKKHKQISELSNSSDSDSGVDSPKLSEENSVLPENSRSSSPISGASASSAESLLSFTEEDNDPQNKEKTELKHRTTTRTKGPSGRNLPSKYQKKTGNPGVTPATNTGIQNTNPNGQPIPGTNEDPEEPEEKEEEVISKKQEASTNENNSENTIPEKQPNNRNTYVAFTVGFALSSIGCFIAGITTSGLTGVGLFAAAITSVIAAAITWCLTPPSSELTSANLSPLVADGQKR